MAAVAILTEEQIQVLLERAISPLRLELERLRGGGEGTVLVSLPEAARRLGVDLRTVQRRAKDGRIEVAVVGGERMVRLPANLDPG